MLQVVIQGTYYKDNKGIFDLNKGRWKKEMVYFYDYDEYVGHIIKNMDYADLQRFRLNIYNAYHKLIKFTAFSELDNNGNRFDGYKLQSPIIEIDNTDFAELIPNYSYRKRFFLWDSIKEKYYLKGDFINYVNLNV